MSYKLLQLSPLSTRGTRMKILIRGPWSSPPVRSTDASFLRSWLTYDSALDDPGAPRHFNWNGLLGFVIAAGISASIWAGVSLILAQLWK